MGLFEADDRRRQQWIAEAGPAEEPKHYARKYRQPRYDAVTEYPVALRLAELHLIRAEARIRLNDPAGAREDLDAVRLRAGLNPLATGMDSEALTAILRAERRRELFTEWGHRWLDLKRWNLAEAVLGSTKPHFKPTAIWLPIPQDQRLYNPNLTQNNGY